CAIAFFTLDSPGLFHIGHELLEKEVFVSPITFDIIEVSALARVSIWHDNDHRRGLSLSDGLIGDMHHLTELDPSGLIVSPSMKKVEHRITALRRLVIGRQVDRVFALAFKNLAGHG